MVLKIAAVLKNQTDNKLDLKPIQDVYLSRNFCLHLLHDAMFEFIQNLYIDISII